MRCKSLIPNNFFRLIFATTPAARLVQGAHAAGTYNPDWAVLVEQDDGTQRLYFVVETKSSLFTDDLRDKESAKIECGKAHFAALHLSENPAEYMVARNVEDLLTQAAN